MPEGEEKETARTPIPEDRGGKRICVRAENDRGGERKVSRGEGEKIFIFAKGKIFRKGIDNGEKVC